MSLKTDSRANGAVDTGRWLRVCSYEDRAIGMDGLILMGESLCSVDKAVSLHLTVPDAPAYVRKWAASRPEVELSTERLPELSGWNIKPSLLLRELDAGWEAPLWLDSDMIVSQPISKVVQRYSREALLLAEEWTDAPPLAIAEGWGLKSKRPISVVNNCFVRVTQAHRPMMERWREMLHDSRYRAAQALPYDKRPKHFLHDGWPLIALLECEEFGDVEYDFIRRNGEIAQCAGSSGYRPLHRIIDVFRGLPALIHGLGRKPGRGWWRATPVAGPRNGCFAVCAGVAKGGEEAGYACIVDGSADAAGEGVAWGDGRTSGDGGTSAGGSSFCGDAG